MEKPKAKIGDVIVLEAPVCFTDGTLHTAFKVVAPYYKRGRSMLQAIDNGRCYRIPNLNSRNFRIVGINEKELEKI